MVTNIIIAVSVVYLYHCFFGLVPDNQPKKTETELEVDQFTQQPLPQSLPQLINRGAGIETLYRTSSLEKTIIKELEHSDGETFPEDYEYRLFTLSRGSININALSEDELDEINKIFSVIKDQMIELSIGDPNLNQELIKAADIEAVYVYSFSHKAATLKCLTSNDICQPADTQHSTLNAERTAQSNDESSMLDDYKNMFSSEWILEQSEARLAGYRESTPALYLVGADFNEKKILQKQISDFISLTRLINKNEAFPTMGFRAVLVMTGSSKKNIYIQAAAKSYTLKFDAEQLSNMLKTMPGKQISNLTGLAKKLNKKNNP
ncbi:MULTISPECIES: hypothetical protein [unclassified Endozoicomonas]|uniref:hypothetical protein n=1 Tax=unclassified Endozoicomonas TaxID=2644528 RepID=UPI0021480A38|nr:MULTISPECIES: hypothetical protein [unclassified Endozoicomonas]